VLPPPAAAWSLHGSTLTYRVVDHARVVFGPFGVRSVSQRDSLACFSRMIELYAFCCELCYLIIPRKRTFVIVYPRGVGFCASWRQRVRGFCAAQRLVRMPAKGSDRRPEREARKGDGEAFFHALLEGHDRALPKLIKRNRKLLDVPSVRELMQSAHDSKSAKLLPRERKGSSHDHIPESSPLVFALRFGHTAVVRALLAAGADPNGNRPVLTRTDT
jgi:hypothetical protein